MRQVKQDVSSKEVSGEPRRFSMWIGLCKYYDFSLFMRYINSRERYVSIHSMP